MVPYKLIISQDDWLSHEKLGPIYRKYSDCFNENRQKDWEYNVLILALLYEMTLGTASFWYPYLRILPKHANKLLPCFWGSEVLEELQDRDLKARLEEMKIDLVLAWKRMERVLVENTHLFPKVFHNRELFFTLHCLVSSRCYPRGLIPVADMLNHTECVSSYEFVNTTMHNEGHHDT